MGSIGCGEQEDMRGKVPAEGCQGGKQGETRKSWMVMGVDFIPKQLKVPEYFRYRKQDQICFLEKVTHAAVWRKS